MTGPNTNGDNAFATYETFEGRAGNDFVDGRGGYDQVTYNNDLTTTTGIVVHLAHRDISFVTVSRAPIEKIEQFRARMGWTFPWVSGAGASPDFGRDFGVSFTDEELGAPDAVYNFTARPYPIRELPGLSVFVKGEGEARGEIYHTYSTFARGLEDFLTAYRFIDLTPKGRDEAPGGGMGWLRHHDRYDDANFVDPWAEKPGITAPLPR